MGRAERRRKRRSSDIMQTEDYKNILNLLKWMNLKKMNLKIVSFANAGRGVLSKRMVHSGEELVAVPLKLMVTVGVVNHSQIPDIFNNLNTTPQVFIALWLVHENHLKDQSPYSPYLNVLPKNIECLLSCSERERTVLPSWIQIPVEKRLKEAKDGFAHSVSFISDSACHHCHTKYSDIFNYDKFLWAWTCVNSRCVYYEDEKMSDDGEKISTSSIAMAPFLDFFNHSNAAEVEAKLDCQRGVYSLKTNKPFKRYDQIFIKYGAFSNLRLLVEYGFILDDEDQDIVEFTFEEILRAVKYINPHFADVSKLKFKFVSVNSLNVNLSKSKDDFSWNCNGLLYILVTQDTNLSELLSKTYSSKWSEGESKLIQQIQRRIIEQKEAELTSQLIAMEKVQPCSESFTLAKALVRQYLKILRAGF